MAKRVDWQFVKKLYRAGGMSNCEIVRVYSEAHKDQVEWKPTVTEAAIRKQARLKAWKKDLADKVKKAAREKLVRGEFEFRTKSGDQNQQEEEIIEQAAETIAEVVRSHRKDIKRLQRQEADLLRRLTEDETQIVIGWFKGEATEKKVKMGLEERTRVYQRLVLAIGSRVKLERMAFGIDDDTADPDAPDKIEVHQEF